MNSTESAKRPSGKRPKKRKFTGNIHTRCKAVHSVDESLNNSASGKKIRLQDVHSSFNEHDDCFDGYRVFDKTIMFTNIQNFASCKKCGGDIKLSEKRVRGLSSVFSIECKNCKDLCSFRNSKILGKGKNILEINRRFVHAMRTIGQGHAAMTTFCGVIDFPPPVAEKSYNNIINKLQLCSKEVAEASMQSAALEEVTLTNSSDIIISGDGTWKTRGYSSRVGVCAVIGDKTGKCIDAEVMSSFCKGCDSWKRRKGSPAYKKWKILHVKECLKNHNGSAGMMETVGMVRIFQRSLSHHSVRYTSYIGDGDSKTFSSITASNPYGEDITVSKIECVGHVQKRMGTRLRKLKQMSSKLSDGKSIRGKGRLTDRMIDLVTMYYGNAIRQNKTCLSDMRKAVWAVYFHIRSSDEEPLHSFCPVGPNSWCKYQNQVVEGSVETFRHSNKLPVAVMDAIKPVFNDLSQPKLLQKCLGGKTQNNNESINSLIWKLCPKTLGCGRKIVDISTNEAIVIFNDGNQGRLKIMQSLGLTVFQFAHKFVTLVDIKRIKTAEVHFNLRTKEVRQAKRMQFKTTSVINQVLNSDSNNPYMGLNTCTPLIRKVVGRQIIDSSTKESVFGLHDIWIFSDSRSAIQHLANWRNVRDFTDTDILKIQKRLSLSRQIHFHRISSHVNITGNEIAYSLDRTGAGETTTPAAPLTYLEIFSKYKANIKAIWMIPPLNP
ncbi:uncharacterized protein TNCV_1623261 [Trichonephila clavipes]|nr:uncharacterized protein TNCV_1623261 [Trichonephila clavipes]